MEDSITCLSHESSSLILATICPALLTGGESLEETKAERVIRAAWLPEDPIYSLLKYIFAPDGGLTGVNTALEHGGSGRSPRLAVLPCCGSGTTAAASAGRDVRKPLSLFLQL